MNSNAGVRYLSAREELEAVEDVDQMIFRLRGKDVGGRSAIEVVRALERDDSE